MKRLPALLALCLCAAAPVARADIEVTFDPGTINDLLASVAVQRVEVPLTKETSLTVLLEELRVIGFEPATEEGQPDRILTSLRLRVAELGLSFQLEPRLSLHVVEAHARSTLELRFDRVDLPLPLGKVDIAGMLPPIRFPGDAVFLLAGAEGDVPVRSRIAAIRMGANRLHFTLTLEVQK